ncbi:MAG: hypothetical protein KF868_20385 [Acidobacteria bacterium]|nr:hypothetical protein [Acidobacteriota bacterium]
MTISAPPPTTTSESTETADTAQQRNAAHASSTAARLCSAIVVKSVLEILFVCALVAVAAFVNLHPLVRGAIDIADASRVAGWACDPRSPGEAIEVQLFIDGEFVSARRADEPRPDLVESGAAENPNHGFTFHLAPLSPGMHSVQVFAVRPSFGRSLTLLPLASSPITFVREITEQTK